jgi:hypothetical protein
MIETIGNSFNHASCQCEDVIKKSVKEKKYVHMQIQMDYYVDLLNKTITIDFVPKVIM